MPPLSPVSNLTPPWRSLPTLFLHRSSLQILIQLCIYHVLSLYIHYFIGDSIKSYPLRRDGLPKTTQLKCGRPSQSDSMSSVLSAAPRCLLFWARELLPENFLDHPETNSQLFLSPCVSITLAHLFFYFSPLSWPSQICDICQHLGNLQLAIQGQTIVWIFHPCQEPVPATQLD